MSLSIIIPSFNRPDKLITLVNAFLKVKIEYEIIIIDDVSTNENITKIEMFLDQINCPNVIFYKSTKKLFAGGARNVGLTIAKKDWIFFIDDDDEPTYQFIEFLNKKELKKKYILYRFPYYKKINGIKRGRVFNCFPRSYLYSVQPSTYIIQRQYLIDFNIKWNEKLKWNEDTLFHMFLYWSNNKNIRTKYVAKVHSIYYCIEYNSSSLTRKKMENCFFSLEAFNVFEKQKFHIKKTYMIILILGPWKLINENFYIDNIESKKMLLNMYLRLNAKSRDYIKLNWFHYFRSIYFRIWCLKELRKQKKSIGS